MYAVVGHEAVPGGAEGQDPEAVRPGAPVTAQGAYREGLGGSCFALCLLKFPPLQVTSNATFFHCQKCMSDAFNFILWWWQWCCENVPRNENNIEPFYFFI